MSFLAISGNSSRNSGITSRFHSKIYLCNWSILTSVMRKLQISYRSNSMSLSPSLTILSSWRRRAVKKCERRFPSASQRWTRNWWPSRKLCIIISLWTFVRASKMRSITVSKRLRKPRVISKTNWWITLKTNIRVSLPLCVTKSTSKSSFNSGSACKCLSSSVTTAHSLRLLATPYLVIIKQSKSTEKLGLWVLHYTAELLNLKITMRISSEKGIPMKKNNRGKWTTCREKMERIEPTST